MCIGFGVINAAFYRYKVYWASQTMICSGTRCLLSLRISLLAGDLIGSWLRSLVDNYLMQLKPLFMKALFKCSFLTRTNYITDVFIASVIPNPSPNDKKKETTIDMT